MIKITLILLIIASFFIFGCQNETKQDSDVQVVKLAQMLRQMEPNDFINSLVCIAPVTGISIWKNRYYEQFHRYPDSKEQLKEFVNANPKLSPAISWDNIEELSIDSQTGKILSMKGTTVFKKSDGNPIRIPFSFGNLDPNQFSHRANFRLKDILIDPNDLSPETKARLAEQLKDILKK
jgi:hypothetical protein